MDINKVTSGLDILCKFNSKDIEFTKDILKVSEVVNLFCNEYLKQLSVLGFKCKLVREKKDEAGLVIERVEDWSFESSKEVKEIKAKK